MLSSLAKGFFPGVEFGTRGHSVTSKTLPSKRLGKLQGYSVSGATPIVSS
jgi:hypothetical protein